jgi:hypothetical protein
MNRCTQCERPYLESESSCPFCRKSSQRSGRLTRIAGLLLTPAVLSACYGVAGMPEPETGDPGDTGTEDTSGDHVSSALGFEASTANNQATSESTCVPISTTPSATGQPCAEPQ